MIPPPTPMAPAPEFRMTSLLKQDLLGRVERGLLVTPEGEQTQVVRRNLKAAAWPLRYLARYLAWREVRALEAAAGVDHIPRLLAHDQRSLLRSWIPGHPLQAGGPPDSAYFSKAQTILDALHARGITHNDLHKEPNLLVDDKGHPALVDFQLASRFRRRGAWYRTYVHEDRRHLLKHKRRYFPAELTPEEHAILQRPSLIARTWRATVKQPYNFITRHLLHWRDREGLG